MAFGEAVLKIKMLLDSSQATAGMDKAAGKTSGMASKFAAAAGAFAGGVLVSKVVSFGKASVAAAQESAVASERLGAVFKATGDTTGEAAKQAEAYALALSNKTGVDDEVIMGGQAMLATFKDVSSATARQAGIFDRATQAGADLAAAGFGSIDSNARQLGKALQDPAKGLTALARSGVTFTAAQKDQIAALQKSGDLLGAQKVVLAAVESQVGGTAEATATGAQKSATAYENMQEALGAKLLPVVTKFQEVMVSLFNFISANSGWLTPIVIAVGGLAAAFIAVSVATRIWAAAQLQLNVTMMGFPVVWILAAIIAVVVIIAVLWNKCAWFRSAVMAVWAAVRAAFQAAASGIMTALSAMGAAFQAVGAAMAAAWRATSAAIMAALRAMGAGISAAFSWIVGVVRAYANIVFLPWRIAFDLLVAIVTGKWGQVISIFASIPGRISGALGGLAHAIGAPFEAAFNAVKSIVGAAVDWIGDKIASVGRVISGAIDTAKSVYNAFARTWNAIQVTMPSFDTHIPGIGKVGGFTLGLPDLPLLASGAYVKRATLAVVGEGRGGEFVTPEAMLRQLIRQEAGSGARVIVNVAPTANPAETGRAVANALRSFFAAGGRLSVPA